jgi:hypothetical protein
MELNEEIFWQEIAHEPVPLKRLPVRLQTKSADFNDRLLAYLISHQAIRLAIHEKKHCHNSQQYPMEKSVVTNLDRSTHEAIGRRNLNIRNFVTRLKKWFYGVRSTVLGGIGKLVTRIQAVF